MCAKAGHTRRHRRYFPFRSGGRLTERKIGLEQVNAIELIGITKRFGPVVANDNVSMVLKRGEILSLLGENGSGKTTLMNMLSGIYFPDEGEIHVKGQPVTIASPKDAFACGIGMIHQHFKLVDVFTATENVVLGLEEEGRLDLKAAAGKIREICDKYGFVIDPEKKVYDMSVSEKQTVEIIKVLYRGADILILDEPTAVLTPQETDRLFDVMRNMKADGKALIIITHKLHEVMDVSDRVAVLRKGRYIGDVATKDTTPQKLTDMMVGRTTTLNINRPEPKDPTPRLEVKNLTVPGAFEDVSFELKPGQILGITGLLDSGRTELSLALFGLRKASGGDILMKGQKVTIENPRDAIAAGIGLVPEDRLSEGLFLPQPISDNIVISEIDGLSGALSVVDRKRRQDEVDKWVRDLAIATPNPDNACTTLSGGNQQRIVLAKWLACKPDVLILNGPTVGVDIGSKHDIHAILQRLANQGMAVIIISDDLPEVLENCSDLLVMRAGRIVARLDPATTDEALVLQHMM